MEPAHIPPATSKHGSGLRRSGSRVVALVAVLAAGG